MIVRFCDLGMMAPVILSGKQLLQDVCRDGSLGWDDEVPPETTAKWFAWLEGLSGLESLQMRDFIRSRALSESGALNFDRVSLQPMQA